MSKRRKSRSLGSSPAPTASAQAAQRLAHSSRTFPEADAPYSAGKTSIVLVVILGGFIFLQWLLPLRTAVKIGADEGFELAKATLCLHGYKMYSEVWDDQPPLDTVLITQIVKHISHSILWPRLLTVSLTLLLLISLFFAVLRIHGLLAASLAGVWLIAAPGFLELSCSTMQELPALAPAVAALAVLAVVPNSRWHLAEICAGVLFATALDLKFIEAVYLPLAGLLVWLRSRKFKAALGVGVEGGRGKTDRVTSISRGFPKSLLISLLCFAISLVAGFFLLNLLIGQSSYWLELRQTWASHFAAPKSFAYGSPKEHSFEWNILLRNWDTTIPAVLGIVFCVRKIRAKPYNIVPLAWLALTLAVISLHTPWWSYYYVHNSVPLCWCAAIGIAGIVERVRRRRSLWLAVALTAFCLPAGGWMGARLYLQVRGIRQSPQLYSDLVLKQVERLRAFTKFMYTDEPVYSFHADIPQPPQLGVISLKRFWSGDLSNARIAEVMKTVQPGLLLIANSSRQLPFSDLITGEYRLVYEDQTHFLYAHRRVLQAAARVPPRTRPQPVRNHE